MIARTNSTTSSSFGCSSLKIILTGKWFVITCAVASIAAVVILSMSAANMFPPIGSKAFIAAISIGSTILLLSFSGLIGTILAQNKNKKNDNPITQIKVRSIPPLHASFLPTKNTARLDDEQIIKNLQKQGYEGPFEEGGGGRCLFLSILPQIRESDLLNLSSSNQQRFKDWKELDKNQKAHLLRQIALEEEEQFLNNLPQGNLSNLNDLERIKELYKDMLEEVEKKRHADIRQQVRGVREAEMLTYCINHFQTYKKNTLRFANWAGTSELISIGILFKRRVMAFGQDFASSEEIKYDDKGNVLPYYASPLEFLPPILVFQCDGGGHYKRLEAPPNYDHSAISKSRITGSEQH